jgi:hypothetical protein
VEPFDAKPHILYQLADWAIEMATARQMLPSRGQVILPPLHARFRRASVFDKKKLTTGFEHAAHLRKRMAGVPYAAQGPGRDNSVDASVIEGNVLCRAFDDFQRD